MKASPNGTQRRRSSGLLLASTALLFAGTPFGADAARGLRRNIAGSYDGPDASVSMVLEDGDGGYASTLDDYLVEGEEIFFDEEEGHGFIAVGEPLVHQPLDMSNSSEYDSDEFRRRRAMQEPEELEEPEHADPKAYVNDESLSFVDPAEDEHERHERQCGADEKLWVFRFRTDNYGYEQSWKLEVQTANGAFEAVSQGPPGKSKYHDNTIYQGATCLKGGKMYKLSIMDAYKDGFCCNYGKGTYSFAVGGITEYDSKAKRTFTDKAEHRFYVGLPLSPRDPTNGGGNNNNNNNNGNGPFQGKNSRCGANKQEVRIKILCDKYGAENSWELRRMDNNQVVPRMSKQKGSYGANSRDDVAACLPYGSYKFTMTDVVGDGICCGAQGDGRYEVYIDDHLSLYGSDFTYGKKVEHTIIVGYHTRFNQLSTRELQYWEAHNWRRKQYHEERFNSKYVPMEYDFSLQEDAQSWANELLKDCNVQGIKHEPGVIQGENLCKNTGTGKWGQLYPVENICRRWFEREETWPYPDNAHFTQGLWASSIYMGCAESEKVMANGGMCRVQVCRYSRAGNCNMGKYQANKGENWATPMLMTHNPCGPPCPPNGCH
ncbi:hypothetical protein ACHAXT_004216 [Thalassiosira profunda]